MWVIFGTKEASRRIPGGAHVVRHCDACGETTSFYEKDKTSTFRLYFIDVYDYKKHRVMECGACGACYATDEVDASRGERDIGGSIEKTLEQGGEAAKRFAGAVGEKLTSLAAKVVDRPPPHRARREDERTQDRDREREAPPADLSEDDLAALDELEQKFRALEEEDDRKRRGG